MRRWPSLWSLANGITSFAVLQALAFLYALGRADFLKAITNVFAQRAIVSATIVFTLGYCFAVWTCQTLATALDSHREIWAAVTAGRIACIVVFNVMVLGIDLSIAKTRGVW
jgi:predicted lysophospholipase L1 biosynthesis ABC-type transport system permease subunit